MSSRAASTLLSSSLFLLYAGNARALEIGLEMRDCPKLSAPRVRELMQLELTTPVVVAREVEPLAAVVSVACDANDVSIRVSDTTTSKLVSRSFSVIEPEPDVRARAVALAAAELVLTSWMELVLAKPPGREKPAPPRMKEDRRVAGNIVRRRTRSEPRVDALLALGLYGGTLRADPGSFGAGARVSLAAGVVGVDADVIATFESERSSLGRVRSDTWSLALRPALRLERGAWLLSAGVGARAGIARIDGTAADPSATVSHTVAGGWGGPLVHVNAGFAADHFVVRLGGEAGIALRGVSGTVDDREHAGVRGPWFMLTLGVGWGS